MVGEARVESGEKGVLWWTLIVFCDILVEIII